MKNSVLLFALAFLTNSFAQDPQLFDNTWYLQKVVIGANDYFPPSNTEVEFVGLTFYNNSSNEFDTNVCNVFFGEIVYGSNQNFTILDSAITLLKCDIQDNSIFEGIYFGFFLDSYNNHLEDPFPYVITTNGNEKTLIITNTRDDIAIYGDQILSNYLFENAQFSIYPNPVKNTLNVQNQKNSLSDVSVLVFDICGKLVKFEAIEEGNSNISLNVSHLINGIYFLTIKNKVGHKQILKFIKQ
ncbi:MAG: T9SS type A sorting domain-containing protein [Flavobacteriales bacterium]|nr:T9SS type A sorting domain-containing protein [Flavobacteriales bacterium]